MRYEEDFYGENRVQLQGEFLLLTGTWCVYQGSRGGGGLGGANLEIRNISLVLRWWWKTHTEPESLWAMVAITLRGIQPQEEGPRIWVVKGSFFLGPTGKDHETVSVEYSMTNRTRNQNLLLVRYMANGTTKGAKGWPTKTTATTNIPTRCLADCKYSLPFSR